MSYDRWDSHADSAEEDGFGAEAGATHIGMYLAWCHAAGLLGKFHFEEFPEDVEKLAKREITPGAWFLSACDGKFWDEDLNDEGNEFTKHYYNGDGYFADYVATCKPEGENSDYSVPDTWNSFEKLKPVLDERLRVWRENNG